MAIPTSGLIIDLDGEYVQSGALIDQSGAGNDFTLYGNPTIGIGFDGTDTVSFDGVDDEARRAGNNIFTSSFTLVAMVYLADQSKHFSFMQGWDGYGSGWSINAYVTSAAIGFSLIPGSPIQSKGVGFTFPESMLGKPLFVAWRYQSGSGIDVSYNEVRSANVATFSNTGLRSSNYGAYFGRQHYTSTHYSFEKGRFLGYNRYLSDSELDDILLALYAHQAAGTVLLDGAPLAGAEVRFYQVGNGAFLGSTTTDANGDYSKLLLSDAPVYVMAVPPAGYRPLAHGPITPIPA